MKWRNLEIHILLFLLTMALFFLTGIHTFSRMSQKSMILAMILGASMGYFFLSLYFYFLKNKILKLKNIPTLSALMILFFSLFILNYCLDYIAGFITYNVVNSISYSLLLFSILFVAIFVVYKGLGGIVRSAFLYFLTMVFLLAVAFVFLFPKMDFQNVLPLIDTDFTNILKSAGLYMIISLTPYFYLPFFELYWNDKRIRYFKKGFLLTQVFFLFYTLIVVSILGISITNLYAYPEVSIFKKVSFLNIVDRMESVFSLGYFLAFMTYFTMTLYGVLEILTTKFIAKEKRTVALFLIVFFLLVLNGFYKTSIVVWFLCQILLLLISCFTLKPISKQR